MSFRLTRPAESFYLLLLIFRDTFPLQLSTCHALRKIFNELFTTSGGEAELMRLLGSVLEHIYSCMCVCVGAFM